MRWCVVLGFASAICFAESAGDFAGTWFFKSDGLAFFKLVITTNAGDITGSLTTPRNLTIDQDGAVVRAGGAEITRPIQKAELQAGRLLLMIDGDDFVVTRDKDEALSMRMEGKRPWRLERDPGYPGITTSLPEERYSPEIAAVRTKLRAMVDRDQAARLESDEKKADDIDARNRPELRRIFDRFGWVTNSLAGKDAAHDFWLLVQHQSLEMQEWMLPALKAAADNGGASRVDYVYLYDRVQMGLGKPQHWGTQAKCDDGKPMLYPVDDLAGLDDRRKELFMLPESDYLRLDSLVKFCAKQAR